MKKEFYLTLFLLFILIGCYASKPITRIEKNISLSKFKYFEVAPVVNKTGETFEFDVADELTKYIKSTLVDKGHDIAEGTEPQTDILLIKSNLLAYKPGSAFKRWLLPGLGKTQATVRTLLIDKKSGETIEDIVLVEVVSAGGFYTVGADKWILKVISKGLVNEIDQRMGKPE